MSLLSNQFAGPLEIGAGKAPLKKDEPRNLGNLPHKAADRETQTAEKHRMHRKVDPFADHSPFFCSDDLNCDIFGSFSEESTLPYQP